MAETPRDDDPTSTVRALSGTRDPDAGHAGVPEGAMWNSVGYLLSGPLVFGGLGWGADHLLNTGFLIVLGLLAGMGLSLYLVWFRYGTEQQ